MVSNDSSIYADRLSLPLILNIFSTAPQSHRLANEIFFFIKCSRSLFQISKIFTMGLMYYSTTKLENDANQPSCFQQLQVPVLYNKTTSIPLVKYLAKFLSTPLVKYEKIADSRKIFNPTTPTLFFSLENLGTHKSSHIR